MSQERDYYAILQVHPSAEPEVIEAAYRRLAAKYHPDVNPSPDATARMQAINEAHRVLSDPSLRAAYDARRAVSTTASGSEPHAERGQRTLRYLGWFIALFLLSELYWRVGGRGLLILVALGGLFYLLWKSRRIF